MPAIHHIDNDNRLIITRWEGEATDANFEQALRSYLKDIRSNPECSQYNEIVDIRDAEPMKITINGLLSIGRTAIDTNIDEKNLKMALIVNTGFTHTFANLYVFYRNLARDNRKRIAVFLDEQEAYEWVKSDA